MSSGTYKCKECGGKVTSTGRRQEIKKHGENIGKGIVFLCSKCKTPYIVLTGQWFEDILTTIEPLDFFKEEE